MADIDETKGEEKQEDEKKREATNRKTSGGVLPWIIMFVVVVSCGGAGFVLGRLFAASIQLIIYPIRSQSKTERGALQQNKGLSFWTQPL